MKQLNFWDDLTTWVGELSNETNVPWVHSVSYGSQGDYPSISYRDRLNAEFQKVGVRGVSILFASGDDGAGCQGIGAASPQACDCTFYPSFPATCPYTTSVGATKFISGASGPEAAVSLFKSGGGFSQAFPTQDYQSDDVEAYLKSGVELPAACSFNATGRATPDVAALGDEHFQVINGGSTIAVGGTSASCPTFSAIVTLLNDLRLNNGKSTLGFLNPFLYQIASSNPTAFFDVTEGDNKNTNCCRSGSLDGFLCSAGWDPVTGLGTPNYEVLKTLV
jgi:tripeptidyl-peptidase-1